MVFRCHLIHGRWVRIRDRECIAIASITGCNEQGKKGKNGCEGLHSDTVVVGWIEFSEERSMEVRKRYLYISLELKISEIETPLE